MHFTLYVCKKKQQKGLHAPTGRPTYGPGMNEMRLSYLTQTAKNPERSMNILTNKSALLTENLIKKHRIQPFDGVPLKNYFPNETFVTQIEATT